jgi:hypothetical protein
LENGKLAKAQAIKAYIQYKVLVWPGTLEAVKMVINTSAKTAKTMLSTFHHLHTRNMCSNKTVLVHCTYTTLPISLAITHVTVCD